MVAVSLKKKKKKTEKKKSDYIKNIKYSDKEIGKPAMDFLIEFAPQIVDNSHIAQSKDLDVGKIREKSKRASNNPVLKLRNKTWEWSDLVMQRLTTAPNLTFAEYMYNNEAKKRGWDKSAEMSAQERADKVEYGLYLNDLIKRSAPNYNIMDTANFRRANAAFSTLTMFTSPMEQASNYLYQSNLGLLSDKSGKSRQTAMWFAGSVVMVSVIKMFLGFIGDDDKEPTLKKQVVNAIGAGVSSANIVMALATNLGSAIAKQLGVSEENLPGFAKANPGMVVNLLDQFVRSAKKVGDGSVYDALKILATWLHIPPNQVEKYYKKLMEE